MWFGMKKKTLLGTSLSIIVTLVLLLAFGGMTVFADGELPSGTCGQNLKWELDSHGRLVVSGSGAMDDYTGTGAPWNAYIDEINTVTIKPGVTSIGNNAFNSCQNLNDVYISGSVTIIKECAFFYCSELRYVELHEGLETIGVSAFRFCNNLYDISIPSSVNDIGQYAFEGCTSIESISVPVRVTHLEKNSFAGCSRLNTVILPNSLTYIGDSVFSGCTSLKSIDLPDNLTMICEHAFEGSGLESIYIPLKVQEIGRHAFDGCQNLQSVEIANGVREIKDYAFYQTGVTSITIPSTVSYIGEYAFMDCKQLTTVEIRDGVDTIWDYAFKGCSSLKTVTIPASVHVIFTDAFYGCTSVTDVYCDTDPTGGYFNWQDVNCDDFKLGKQTRCYVKAEYLEYYKTNFKSVNVTFVSQTVDMGLGEHLYGHTVSLAGDIGVNFYMKLSDEVLASDTAKMVFTITSLDGSDTRTQEIYVSSLDDSLKSGNDCIFKCSVVAKEMTSTITAQMVDGDKKGEVYTYSVQKYAQYILANPSKYRDVIELVKAMLNYGASAQRYFQYNTTNYANSILPLSEQSIPAISASDINADGLQTIGSVEPSKVSLSLESTVTLKLSFKTADLPEGVVFTDKNGNRLKTEISGDYTVVLIKGIPAQDLHESVTIYAGEGNTISYCPLRYCKAVLAITDNPAITDDLKTLVTALYIYNVTINTNYGI